ncbi:MAG: DUF488 domain-containing protein [Syntrophobacteraceae bacterium]
MRNTPGTIYTIGHSTLSIAGFTNILKIHGIALLADVRTVPRSRFNPQFNKDTFPRDLRDAGIAYEHFPGLGGLRHSNLKESPNSGWRSAAFRSYADYMMTPQFEASLDQLQGAAMTRRTAIMCAEAVPWRCHRNLISDALTVRGFHVMHIVGEKGIHEHAVTAWARVSGTDITYPAQDA